MNRSTDLGLTPTGPLPITYVEQIRSEVKARGADLDPPVPVDLCVWKLGDTARRDVTKVGGVPYWPAREPWPTLDDGTPYSFVAQFSFVDSKDVVPKLPGDVLSVLAADGRPDDVQLRWFKLGAARLRPAERVPAPGPGAAHPCHAVLHRTAEYPRADYQLFESYPYPLSSWGKGFQDGTKIGGSWELRGELPDPNDVDDVHLRKKIQESWDRVRAQQHSFICQLGSIQATERAPFLGVDARHDLDRFHAKKFLMIGDVGGYDFFYDGTETWCESWSG